MTKQRAAQAGEFALLTRLSLPNHLTIVLCLVAGLNLVSTPRVLGQVTPQSDPVGVVDTVRVVHDRLPADILDAAMAASEVKETALRHERQIGLDEALDLVPGAVAQSRAGGQDVRITIRGFGARGAGERSNAGTTRGIRILLDGFPITEPDGRTSLDLADLGVMDKVRVVRSNSSVLFGSASGGLIDLVTHAPFDKPFYELRTSYGEFGLTRTHLKGGLVAGSARIRMSGSDTRFDGWRDHSRSATTTLQTSVLATPAARTTIGVFLAGTRNHVEQPGPLTRAQFDADPRQADSTFAANNYRRENALVRLGVRLQQEFRARDALVVTAFAEPKSLHRAERNKYRDFTRYHIGGSGLYLWETPFGESVEMRLNAGVDDQYQDGAILFYNLGPNGSRGPNLTDNTREGINNFGVFAELAMNPAPAWEVSAGGRYDLVHFIFENHLDPIQDDKRTMNIFSPRAAVAYSYRPSHKIYAAVSGGMEAPAFNEVDPPPPFDTQTGLNPFLVPARSLTVEVGTKGLRLLADDGKTFVRYDAAVYVLEVRDDIIPFDAGAYYLTAGKTRRAGIELGGELRTRQGMRARLAANVMHSEYIDYENDLGRFDGNENAGVPNFGLDARLGYDAPVGLYVEGAVHSLGSYFADDANTADIAPYGIVNLTAGFQRAFRHAAVDVFASVENLLDDKYIASVFINGVNGRYFEPGMERNFLVGLALRTN